MPFIGNEWKLKALKTSKCREKIEDRSLEIKELLGEVFSRQAAPATRRSEGKGEGKGEGKSWGDRDEARLGGS